MSKQRLFLITGTNKGIGYGLVERLLSSEKNSLVLMTSRSVPRGKEAFTKLAQAYPQEKDRLIYQQLDISSKESVDNFLSWLRNSYGKVDFLINNAAVGDRAQFENPNAPISPDKIEETMNVNFFSTVLFTEKMLPFLSDTGKIITLTTLLATLQYQKEPIRRFLSNPNITLEELFKKAEEFEELAYKGEHVAHGYSPRIYDVSKVLLNCYVRWILAKKMKESQGCFLVEPGWVKTEMGGSQAPMSVQEGTNSAWRAIHFDRDQTRKFNGKFIDSKGNELSF
jgi:Dehydrogenases with different specificities (related to short-chain alcohol dehydrogenases)